MKKEKAKQKAKDKDKGKKKKDKKQALYTIQTATELIVSTLEAKPQKTLTAKQFHRKFNAHDMQAKAAVEALLEQLVQQGAIAKVGPFTYQASSHAEQIYATGRVDYVSPEFLYVVTDLPTQGDIWVSSRHDGTALDGDTVKVLVHRFRRDKRAEGEIVEIINRARLDFVGKLEISPRFAFVIPDKKKMHSDIFVNLRNIKGAKHGDKVLATITEWEPGNKNPIGIIKQVLGKAGEHETEIHSIMAEYDLPIDFPTEVMAEAEAIADGVTEAEVRKRRDFRAVTTFTIDPEDAQDFDDALSIMPLPNGNWEIGVHIADVTHYVLPDTALEREAYRRATSVYLVDRCVPMLPEKLSNQLCSLRPHEDKLTFSAVFELTDKGKIMSEWFGRTVIRSHRRFTYEEAQEGIESGQGDFAEELQTLNRIAKSLQRDRVKKGAILFETVEVKFKLDERKKPLAIVPKIRKEAHKLIEEFMLLANKRVAHYVFDLRKGKDRNTMVYRTHDAPNPEKMENFATFAKQFGYQLELEGKKLSNSLNELSRQAEGRPEQNILQSLAIRAMAKAKYTTEALSHFGLAFDHYSHFTSPIRRYPDMMAHRLLQHYLDGGAPLERLPLEDRCKHSSEMEKRAADAERASIKYKQVEMMQDLRLSGELRGKSLEGVITGITEWGVFVELTSTRCEGLVRLADIQSDYYEFDERNYSIVGRRYRRVYRLGDTVRVRLKSTDLEKRTIDFFMDEA